jgi:intraflagellar transport protein 52
VRLLVLGAPRDKYTTQEFDTLQSFLDMVCRRIFHGMREIVRLTNARTLTPQGGSILYLGEGNDGSLPVTTNFNYLLEQHGISVNQGMLLSFLLLAEWDISPATHTQHTHHKPSTDCVIRTSYCKYFHPKEVLVTSGILNREINRAAGKRIGAGTGGLVTAGAGKVNPAYVCACACSMFLIMRL